MKSSNKNRLTLDRLLFYPSLFLLTVLLGAFLQSRDIFPGPQIRLIEAGIDEIGARYDRYQRSYYKLDIYPDIQNGPVSPDYQDDRLTLLTYIGKEKLHVDIVDSHAQRVHHWPIDWYRIWPNPDHVTEEERPKSGAGTQIHGLVLLDNGDIVFNFEYLGTVRMDPCGNVVWRLPYRTHHSAFVDSDGAIWLSGMVIHKDPVPDMPTYNPVYDESTILKVSPEGEILKVISLLDILKGSKYESLLYVNPVSNVPNNAGPDPLHMNDVEIFPAEMKPGHFHPGDIMVSLRNLNAIIIIDPKTEQVKELIVGPFVRQHDPDFIDGNTISIFDNYYVNEKDHLKSRIVFYNAARDEYTIHFQGDDEHGFGTWRMGKHQVLENGHVLITETVNGRAFEIDEKGDVVWNYINRVGDRHVGLLQQADRLDARFNREFFARVSSECKQDDGVEQE